MHGSDDTRKATAVLTQFRNRMFKGDLSQSIDFTIRSYETCAVQLELDENQKAKYFFNVLEYSTRRFFYSFLKKDMDLETIRSRMRQE